MEMQLGVIALGQGHYAEAEELFRKLYKEGSTDLEPLAGLVNTYEAEHMPDQALALMQQETETSPDSKGKEALLVATAEAAGKNDVALAELQKMAAQNPTSADVQIRIGQLQQKNGNLPAALQAFERAQQLAPNRRGVDALVATIQEQLGKKTGGDRKLPQGAGQIAGRSGGAEQSGIPAGRHRRRYQGSFANGEHRDPQSAQPSPTARHAGVDTHQGPQHRGGASDSRNRSPRTIRMTIPFAITMRWR